MILNINQFWFTHFRPKDLPKAQCIRNIIEHWQNVFIQKTDNRPISSTFVQRCCLKYLDGIALSLETFKLLNTQSLEISWHQKSTI